MLWRFTGFKAAPSARNLRTHCKSSSGRTVSSKVVSEAMSEPASNKERLVKLDAERLMALGAERLAKQEKEEVRLMGWKSVRLPASGLAKVASSVREGAFSEWKADKTRAAIAATHSITLLASEARSEVRGGVVMGGEWWVVVGDGW